MKKDPFHITYEDLIREAESELQYMRTTFPGKVLNRTMTEWTKNHKIAAKEQLLKLLKKYKREPQGNLFEVFNQVKR